MNYIKKYALYFLTGLVVAVSPAVSMSQGPQEHPGKEAPTRHEIKPKEATAAVPDQKSISRQNESVSDNSFVAGKDKKKEESREEQDQDIMEQALELIHASQEYWVKGDVEGALEMLDQAYAIILDTNGEPDIARQKDDLRLLISKRILSIYNAMQTATTGKKSEIPLIMNADVEKEIRSFQGYERDFFISSYQRSFMYRSMMLKELKQAGLPEELSWLPLVESGFKIAALSRARALGLWQFIPSTGYKYDLDRDDWIDERMDAIKSTRAAIAYLKELHGMFGDWLTVLAAYNCGEGRVMRVISSQHINYLDRFWDLYQKLPYETARYVPRFLATLQIIKDPKKFGMELDDASLKLSPIPYEIVKTNVSMKLQDIAKHLNISEEILNSLNSELRFKITPARAYDLKVPLETAEVFASVVDDIPRYEKPLPQTSKRGRPIMITHRVRQGETIQTIAKKYRTSTKTIRTQNYLTGKNEAIRVGQVLTIPMRPSKIALKRSPQEEKAASANVIPTYKVKKGDTLASIANRYNVSVAELKEINHLKKNNLQTGQTLRLAKNVNGNDSGTKKESATEKKSTKKKPHVKESTSKKEDKG